MKKSVVVVAAIMVFLAAGTAAHAQDQSKRAAAGELLGLLNVKETQQKAIEMYQQMIAAQIQQMNSESKDPAAQEKVTALLNKILDMIKNGADWDKMKEEYITLYSQTYTEPELKDIIAFHKTPSGQTYVKKQPEVLKRSFDMSGNMMKGIMPKIQTAVDEFRKSAGPQEAPKPEAK
ncbi:MAG: DUF2059 domain-containing protein [Pseudomonadota bacterium]